MTTFSGSAGNPTVPGAPQWLDAGASIAVTGPAGNRSLAKTTVGSTVLYSSTLDANGAYLTAGQYTLTGPGGPDVGPFNVHMTLPQRVDQKEATRTVNRSAGVTVNWTGGDPTGFVQITGASSAGATPANLATVVFTCTARASDGSFTVPSIVLLALPASTTQSAGGVLIPIPGNIQRRQLFSTGNFPGGGVGPRRGGQRVCQHKLRNIPVSTAAQGTGHLDAAARTAHLSGVL